MALTLAARSAEQDAVAAGAGGHAPKAGAERDQARELRVGQRREKVALGSHICQLFEDREEAIAVMGSLLASGLAHDERCSMLASQPSVNRIRQRLAAEVPDLTEREARGQITFHTQKDKFLVNGKFDAYYLCSTHQSLLARSLREGWPAVRIGVDMSWLTRGGTGVRDILKYEATCDAVWRFQQSPVIAMAQYDYGRLSANLVVELLKLHAITIVGRFIKRNPHSHNSEQYMHQLLQLERARRMSVMPGEPG